MPINIPDRFLDKIKDKAEWYSRICFVKERAESIFSRDPYFFPEYTEHKTLHINHVLEISNKLIPNDTLFSLSIQSISFYIMSVILHDIGMFITYNTFKNIIESDNIKIRGLDQYSIKHLWDEYLVEIKHSSDKDLIEKFGRKDINFTYLPDEHNITAIDKLVIGEFLRRNHHKLSHYLINSIIPITYDQNAKEDIYLLNNLELDATKKDLIGLIARSHGEDIRKLETYVESKYRHKSLPYSIEVYYLMALLSISDLLDAGEERAPIIVESMYVNYSFVSINEFNWNRCINYEDYSWEIDKKQLSITATVKNASLYTKVNQWFEYSQKTLDFSWAIVNEYYDSNKFKFSIHRIIPNIITDGDFYQNQVTFKANPDILKLLIQPLYGKDPSYGVRELVQNAVDACREREVIEIRQGNTSYTGNVSVNINTSDKTITISDNGTGMSIDTIINYYLTAGSSYRRSDSWSKKFKDTNGQSMLFRNGKFGIGVLATFLLGEKAIVKTKNIKDEYGWEFPINLDQTNIDIIKNDSIAAGTHITVFLSDKALISLENEDEDRYDEIKWYDWYIGKSPIVEYTIDSIKKTPTDYPLSCHWYSLEQNEYESLKWTYELYDESNFSTCNDIKIYSSYGHRTFPAEKFHIYIPTLNIQDKKGALPINLARNSFTAIPCSKELFSTCAEYYLTQLLSLDEHKFSKIRSNETLYNISPMPLLFSNQGYTSCSKLLMSHADIKSYYYLYEHTNTNRIFTLAKTKKLPDDCYFASFNYEPFEHTLYAMLDRPETQYICINTNYCKSFDIYDVNDFHNLEYIEDALSDYNIEKHDSYYIIYRKGSKPSTENIVGLLDKFPIIVFIKNEEINISELKTNDKIMMEILSNYFPKKAIIPYSLEERKHPFKKAFEDLSKYIPN